MGEILSVIHTSAHFGFGSVSTVTIYDAAGGTPARSIILDNILIIKDCRDDPESAKSKLRACSAPEASGSACPANQNTLHEVNNE